MRKFLAQGAPASMLALLFLMVSVVLMVSVGPQPAAAKGLLESLFGFLSPKPAPSTNPQVFSPNGSPRSQTNYDDSRRANPYQDNGWSAAPAAGVGGRYKTICVRLCDGFFFPINHASRRQDFYADAQQCQSRCDTETRLYYMSPSETSVKKAQDLRGLAYAKLQTAFLYRKTLKEGCDCRPKPWSVAERMRHQRYALKAQGLTDGGNEALSLNAAEPVVIADATPTAGEPQPLGEAVPSGRVVAPRPAVIARADDWIDPPRPSAARSGRGDLARQQALYTAPRPLPVVQRSAVQRPVVQRATPPKKTSWGLGATFAGGGLPPVRYKHRWSVDTN